MVPKNALYAQSGGVSAVINASACGVLETARQHPEQIAKVYAGRNGIIGALTEDLIDTRIESEATIAAPDPSEVGEHCSLVSGSEIIRAARMSSSV